MKRTARDTFSNNSPRRYKSWWCDLLIVVSSFVSQAERGSVRNTLCAVSLAVLVPSGTWPVLEADGHRRKVKLVNCGQLVNNVPSVLSNSPDVRDVGER